MTESQHDAAAKVGLILEGAAGAAESADFDGSTLAKESTDQHGKSEGSSRSRAPGDENLGNERHIATTAPQCRS